MTAGTALRASLTIPGLPEHMQDARQFVTQTLDAFCLRTDIAVLLISEVATNSILHSDSGLPGGTVTITVVAIPGGVRVEVLDAGGATVPHLECTAAAVAEGGRGLRLVNELSTCWGFRYQGTGIVTWFEASAEAGP